MKKLPRADPVQPIVETEEVVYTGPCPRNGATPMWCYGNTCVVRINEDVFISSFEKLAAFEPLNDCRWTLFKRTSDGWQIQQADKRGRTREPCPLACLPGGRLLLSGNPTLLGPDATGGGPARPEILAFDAADPRAAYETMHPRWNGSPAFTEHSYHSFAADAKTGELIMLQNVGYTHAEWALLDQTGATRHTGRLNWPPYEDTSMTPYGATHARVNYPVVCLKSRAVHLCGAAAYDRWSRVNTPELAGRAYGNRFRRLLYTFTDEVTETRFCDWIEIDHSFDDGGWVFAGDLHVDAEGTVHLLWYKGPINRQFRDEHFPDIQRRYQICYAKLRAGEVIHRRALVEAGDGLTGPVPTELDNEGRVYKWNPGQTIVGDPISTPRFQVTPDGRLFVIYYVSGAEADGRPVAENRILEIHDDDSASEPIRIPLQHPLTEFFTATPRAGCEPSFTIDLLGYRRGALGLYDDRDTTMSYARIKLR